MILERRKKQAEVDRRAWSQRIAGAIFKNQLFVNSKTILLYLSKKDEVATDDLMAKAFEAGKRVCVPVIKDRDLQISELPGPDIHFRLGKFGVREPVPEQYKEISPDSVDLAVVPGLAFDPSGGRLGYGGGYFDRLLSRLSPETKRIALAFDFQILEAVPQGRDDIRMDIVITEKTTMNCGN